MRDRRRAGFEQTSTTLGYGTHVSKPLLHAAVSTLPFESLSQCDRDCASHRVTGQAREFPGELAGFVVLDVQFHDRHTDG